MNNNNKNSERSGVIIKKNNIFTKKNKENFEKYLTKCQLKILKKLKTNKNIHRNFKDIEKYKFKIISNSDSIYLLLLQIVLNKYYSIKDSINIINYIKKYNNLKEYTIYKKIFKYKFKNTNDDLNKYKYFFNSFYNRLNIIYKYLYGIDYKKYLELNELKNKYEKIYENDNKQHKNEYRYLDLGYKNNNEKINILKKIFNFKNKNIFGSYINLDNSNDNNNFTYKITENGLIDYPDDYFDLVSCWFYLEEVPNLELTMKELKRVTKKDGLIIHFFKERFTIEDKIIYSIDFVIDYFKSMKFNKENYQKMKKKYIQRYLSFYEWNKIFAIYNFYKFGFGKYIKQFNYYPHNNAITYIIYKKE